MRELYTRSVKYRTYIFKIQRITHLMIKVIQLIISHNNGYLKENFRCLAHEE